MTVRFTTTEEEVLAFHRHHYETDPVHVRSRKKVVWVYPMFYVAIGILLSARDFQWTPIVIFSVIALLWILFLPRYLMNRSLRYAKKRMADPNNRAMYFAEREMTFTEDSIHAVTAEADDKLLWSGIVRVDETADAYYLYTSALTAFLLPKRVLTTREEEELRRLFVMYKLL